MLHIIVYISMPIAPKTVLTLHCSKAASSNYANEWYLSHFSKDYLQSISAIIQFVFRFLFSVIMYLRLDSSAEWNYFAAVFWMGTQWWCHLGFSYFEFNANSRKQIAIFDCTSRSNDCYPIFRRFKTVEIDIGKERLIGEG